MVLLTPSPTISESPLNIALHWSLYWNVEDRIAPLGRSGILKWAQLKKDSVKFWKCRVVKLRNRNKITSIHQSWIDSDSFSHTYSIRIRDHHVLQAFFFSFFLDYRMILCTQYCQ